MNVDEFVSMLLKSPRISSRQIENLNRIQDISERFHRDAGIPVPERIEIDEDTIVLESGHQPNFLPYPGVFKKAFMLDFLRKKIEEKGRKCIAVFGFADYNLASAQLLYRNKIPALTRTGFHKIGFKTSEGKWKAFYTVPKPKKGDFEKELSNIRTFYLNSARSVRYPEKNVSARLDDIESEMRESYRRAGNFADMNAFMVSRICGNWGLSVHFFRYTDIQKERIFTEEFRRILARLKEFNSLCVSSVRKNGVEINYSAESLPFWYTCNCGGIVPLSVKGYSPLRCAGTCPSCGRKHDMDIEKSLEEMFPRLSMNAVSRNMIVSEGLGDALYVSGTGGGMKYGKVSNEISDALKFRKPVTMSWKGSDFHLGTEKLGILRDFTKHAGIELKDLADGRKAASVIGSRLADLSEKKKKLEGTGDRQSLFTARNEHDNMISKVRITDIAFSMKPSIMDLFVTEGMKAGIPEIWTSSFSEAELTKENGFYIARNDTIYEVPGSFSIIENDQVVPIYGSMLSLGELLKEEN